MLALLSPAKTLDLDPAPATLPWSLPAMLAETKALHAVVKKLGKKGLADVMDLSDALAELNAERFHDWTPDHRPGPAKQAILTFAGDVYVGLDAATLTVEDLSFADAHVAILSGFYGLLRALDLMMPYRLEMGSKVVTKRGKDLYTFWGKRLAEAVVARLGGHRERLVVNLASQEYWKAVDPKVLAAAEVPVLDVAFKDTKDGEAQTYALFAKKARGMMARHIITARVDRLEGIRDFRGGGYRFDKARTQGNRWVFTRPFRKAGES